MPLLILGVIVIIACAVYINAVNKPPKSGSTPADRYGDDETREEESEKSKVIYLDDMKKKDK